MKRETILEYLERRLDETVGQHSRIALESGVPQSTISRVYRRESPPDLLNAQALVDWFDAFDRRQRPQRRRRSSAPVPVPCGLPADARGGRVTAGLAAPALGD